MNKLIVVLLILLFSLHCLCAEANTVNQECRKKVQEINKLQIEYAKKRKSVYYEDITDDGKNIFYEKNNTNGTTFKRIEHYTNGILGEVEIINATGIWELKDNIAVNIKKIRDLEEAEAVIKKKKSDSKEDGLISCKVEDGKIDGKECFVVTETILIPAVSARGENNTKGANHDTTFTSIYYTDKVHYFIYKMGIYSSVGGRGGAFVKSNVKFDEEFDQKLFEIPKGYKKREITNIGEYKKYENEK